MRNLDLLLKQYHKLVNNFISLGAVQVTQYALPIIVFPFMTRALGMSELGKLGFCTSFIQYFITAVSYGFNLDITREIASSQNNQENINKIIRSTLSARIYLCILSFVLVLPITFLIPELNTNLYLILILTLQIFGEALLPTWYFQGIESTQWVSSLQILLKLISALLIIIFVNTKDDLILAGVFQSVPIFLIGTIACIRMHQLQKIRFKIESLEQVIIRLKNSWIIFLSTISITLYTNTNTFILGIFAPMESVGYFIVSEKIIRAAMSIPLVLSQTIYPHVCSLFKKSTDLAKLFLRKIAIFGTIFFIILGFVIIASSNWICSILAPSSLPNSVFLLQIMAFLPLSLMWDNIFGTQILLNINKRNYFTFSIITSGFLSLFASFILMPFYYHIGAALSFIISQLSLLVLFAYFTFKSDFKLFNI